MTLHVIRPAGAGPRLETVLDRALTGRVIRVYQTAEELQDLRGQKLLFAVGLDETGLNFEYIKMLARLRQDQTLLEGSAAGILVDGPGELFTKSTAAELAFTVNQAGCALVGRPLVEATGTLENFRIQAQNLHTDLAGAYQAAVEDLISRLFVDFCPKKDPELLVLHASSHHTSNTMALWEKVRVQLGEGFTVTEIGLRNGTLSDCSGCPYTLCLHCGEKGGCFYGGLMQQEVDPAVRRCDGIVMLCPNYNDALSANLTACINRLTALFRQTRFYDKALFAVVVSGYSGGDILARQLIAAMNMNKSVYLPPRFALLETANDPGQAVQRPGVDQRLDAFAQTIRDTLRCVE